MRFCLSSLKELVFILSFLKNVARLSTTHLFEAASLIYRIILDLHFKIDVYWNIQSSVYVGSQFSVSIALQHIRVTHFKKTTLLKYVYFFLSQNFALFHLQGFLYNRTLSWTYGTSFLLESPFWYNWEINHPSGFSGILKRFRRPLHMMLFSRLPVLADTHLEW